MILERLTLIPNLGPGRVLGQDLPARPAQIEGDRLHAAITGRVAIDAIGDAHEVPALRRVDAIALLAELEDANAGILWTPQLAQPIQKRGAIGQWLLLCWGVLELWRGGEAWE